MKIEYNNQTCPHCGKVINGNWYIYMNHIQRCEHNPKSKEINKKRSEKNKNTIYKNQINTHGNIIIHKAICENCGKEFTYEAHEIPYKIELVGKSRFCSKHCAHSFSGKMASRKEKTKITTCCKCGKEYEVSKYFCVDKYHICNECKDNEKIYKQKLRKEKLLAKKSKKVINKRSSFKESWLQYKLDLTIKDNVLAIRRLLTREKYYKDHNWNCPKLQPHQCKICGKYHCNDDRCKQWNAQSISTLVKYFNFDTSAIGTKRFYEKKKKIKLFLYNEYCVKKIPFLFIANQLGAVDKTIYNLLVKLGLEKINHDAWHVNYKRGEHISWNGKISKLKSSYEFNYAYILDKNKIDYDVEPFWIKYYDTILDKERKYLPDFYIPSTNTIVEIKGNFTYNEQNLKDKFRACKELGYNVKLIYGPHAEEKDIKI